MPTPRLAGPPRAAILLVVLLVPIAPALHARRAESELARHAEKLGVAAWHAAGHRGKGVKVCVLDTDFAGFRDELGVSLPRAVLARSFRSDRDLEQPRTGHGTRAAQVVHALAPGAELLLANWDAASPENFLDAVRWAKGQGAKVITCSVTSAAWGDGEGGGPVHRRLTALLGGGTSAGDPLFLCAAGNMATGHWSGVCRPNKDRLHQWRPGAVDNRVAPYGTAPIKISLLHKPGSTYEALVYDADGSPVAREASGFGELPGPGLTFTPRRGQKYRLRVRHVGGTPGAFHCVVRHANLELASALGSVCCFPADNPSALTVGAIDWSGQRLDYSACVRAGAALKPELVVPVPFPCPGKFATFGGTSAAAPQAAAVAALLAGRYPHWTADQLREGLLAAARPLGKGGPSPETGHGRLALPAPRAK
jgi:subtilisin family serine protease